LGESDLWSSLGSSWQQYSQTFPAAPAGTAKVLIGYAFDTGEDNYLDDCAITSPASARGVAWSEAYVYDGFGNMTEKDSPPSSMQATIDPATNRIVGEAYDGNGNDLGPAGFPRNTFDAENRLVSQTLDGKQYTYAYDPWGRRVMIHQTSPAAGPQYTFYGPAGDRYGPDGNSYAFAGQMVRNDVSGSREAIDRLGSVRATTGSGRQYRYLPYGAEETGQAADGQVMFGTYVRDSTPSAQDYAGQRYYSNLMGRFLSPDPGGVKTANPKNPGSWNRYAYVNGDPVNFADPPGLYVVDCVWDGSCFNPRNPGGYGGDWGATLGGLTFGGPLWDVESESEQQYAADVAAHYIYVAAKPIAHDALSLNTCAGLFNLPGGETPWQLLTNDPRLNFTFSPEDNTDLFATTTDNLNQTATTNYNTDIGGAFLTGTATANADTIIHELLHAAVAIFGADAVSAAWQNNDDTDATQASNEALISTNCFH
jgi:RHS repeat-associated protein